MKEIPRELSVCAHVLNNDSKPLMIDDLTKDQRTKHVFELNNSLLNKTFPKFYAGSPIITSNGFTLGSFCVFNSKPKTLNQEVKKKWGLNRSLINNAIKGVNEGYSKILELTGVGFRAAIKGNDLNLQIGFSHDVNFKFPKDVKIQVEKQTIIKINGVDKELVSKIASDIKSLKPVEPYKGKGIKERNQYFLRKEGKKK